MHYYQFNIGDYASHTQHLDEMEDLAYRRMIDWCYLNEMPLPDDVDDIARLIRMRSHTECIAVVLREFFERNADGFVHPRIERDLCRFKAKSEKAKKSAMARWGKKPSNHADQPDANALRTVCEGNANQEPITNNQESDRSEDQSPSPELIREGFEHFWSTWKLAKKKLGKVDTSPKGQTFEKKWKPLFNRSYWAQHGEEGFKREVDQICEFVIASHSVEGFNRFENMQTGKFFTEKQWRDQ